MTKKTNRKQPVSWLLRRLVPLVIIVAWLAAAGIGGPYFGQISEVSSNDPATFLPKSAEATAVNNQLEKFRDSSTVPAIVVLETKSDINQQKSLVDKIRNEIDQKDIAADSISPAVLSEDKKAALIVVPIASDGEFDVLVPQLKSVVQRVIDDSDAQLDYYMTGPALFSRDLQAAFAGIDGTLLAVALSVVFVILLVVYRSPILPIVTLTGAMAALCGAIIAVFYLAKADVVMLNGQVQGILFILTIGAATDYSLLYIARYREELLRAKSAWQATKTTWRASLEPIVAAGGTVTLGLFCLLASDLGSNQALGPVGGIGVVFAVLVALTFLPAALLLLGRKAFWPKPPKYRSTRLDSQSTHAVWQRVAAVVSRHPRRLWVGIGGLLLVACLGVLQLDATGVSQENLILGKSDARDGQIALERHFAEGSGSPAYLLTPRAELADTVKTIDQSSGVESVSVVTSDSKLPSKPVGKQAAEIEAEIRETIETKLASQRNRLKRSIEASMVGAPANQIEAAYRQAALNIPSVDELVEQANSFEGISPKVVDDKVLLEATLSQPSSSVAAQSTIKQLRTDLNRRDLSAQIGGLSAVQLDTITASDRDLVTVLPLILVAITIVLMFLLRSVVAPLILVATTVISFGATLGVAALLFNHLWDFPGADPAVVIFGFVFLVALGIDYNIFLMTRVREETIQRGVRQGTLHALIVTGGVITSAGAVLAATFAALYVIPILFLAQIAFIVAFGVLVDTLIVRSLLVPALTMEVGRKMWWPSKLSKAAKKD